MGIALYGFQSIFSFVATELPSNSTDPGILKFCFLVVSFLNCNNGNVKMINVWENRFLFHVFTNIHSGHVLILASF